LIGSLGVDPGTRCGIVTEATEWPATIDRRYHDAVIFGLDSVITETAPGAVATGDSTVPLLRRLRDVGIAAAVYSSTRACGQALRAVGIEDLVSVVVDNAETAGNRDWTVVATAATRLGVRPIRCVVIECDEAGVRAGRDGGFSLVIGLQRNGHADELLSCGADAVIADLAEISVRSGGTAMASIADAQQVYSQLKELATSWRPAVFLDFDGTLSDIVEDPRSATLVDGAADALRALAAQCPVAVVSGRDLADVRGRVKVDGVWYAGSHGVELVAPDGTHHENVVAADVIGTLAHAASRLAETLSDVSGVAVEHKRFAVAVHYRNADPKDVDRVIAAVRKHGRSEGLRIDLARVVPESEFAGQRLVL
jgi:alpha,alpha-trehalase